MVDACVKWHVFEGKVGACGAPAGPGLQGVEADPVALGYPHAGQNFSRHLTLQPYKTNNFLFKYITTYCGYTAKNLEVQNLTY